MTTFAALYADEDMSALVATLLRSRGLNVTTVPEQATLGKTDSEQLEFATSENNGTLLQLISIEEAETSSYR